MNALCLCRGCHLYAHQNPKNFMKWFESSFKERFDYLERAKNIISFRSEEDYEKLLENLKGREFWGLIQIIE
jgi:hypothetical protein